MSKQHGQDSTFSGCRDYSNLPPAPTLTPSSLMRPSRVTRRHGPLPAISHHPFGIRGPQLDPSPASSVPIGEGPGLITDPFLLVLPPSPRSQGFIQHQQQQPPPLGRVQKLIWAQSNFPEPASQCEGTHKLFTAPLCLREAGQRARGNEYQLPQPWPWGGEGVRIQGPQAGSRGLRDQEGGTGEQA